MYCKLGNNIPKKILAELEFISVVPEKPIANLCFHFEFHGLQKMKMVHGFQLITCLVVYAF